MSNLPIEEPAEGNALGTALRVLYVHGYHQGYDDCSEHEKPNSNHNKDAAVAEAYAQVVRTLGDPVTPSIDELRTILAANRAYELHESEHSPSCTCHRLSEDEAVAAIQELYTPKPTTKPHTSEEA